MDFTSITTLSVATTSTLLWQSLGIFAPYFWAMLHTVLQREIGQALAAHYQYTPEHIEFQQTRKEFEGDITVVLFPWVKATRVSPQLLGQTLGEHLLTHAAAYIEKFSVAGGFLNLLIRDAYYGDALLHQLQQPENITRVAAAGTEEILVEYASPNTNKPLHLGHLRNILLGHATANVLEAAGKKVKRVQVINDRGIHICKSMLAWQKDPASPTPESAGMKGDHLVGAYYVAFDQQYKKETAELQAQGLTEEAAKKEAPILKEAQDMLLRWEQNDPQTRQLWHTMNQWVYAGFEHTFKRLGVSFDKNYYESDTYVLGKDIVTRGLDMGVFFRKPDGSVWIDLTAEGLDEKLVLRADGTSVYITQDLGTAVQRFEDFAEASGMIYTVGNEQDYHFKVLFAILKKLGYAWADQLYHLSYGMVELPHGKMKSREGTVVDADDLMDGMTEKAGQIASELGKLDGFTEVEKAALFEQIGQAALKYYILKVDPRKTILFNPEESIDFNGNTGPFIQYAHARICSLLHKAQAQGIDWNHAPRPEQLDPKEKNLIKWLLQFPEVIDQAADQLSPALLANYTYELVKLFNSMYQTVPVLAETDASLRAFRLQLCQTTGALMARACGILGFTLPERM